MKFDWRAISGPVLADQRQVQGRQGSALFLHGAAQRPMHAELHTVTELIRHTDDPASADRKLYDHIAERSGFIVYRKLF